MNKIVKFLLISAVFVLTPFNSASASQWYSSTEVSLFEKIHMTDDYGSFTQKDTFGWDEKPYLHMKLYDTTEPIAGWTYGVTAWVWNNLPSGEHLQAVQTFSSVENDIWVTFTDSYWNNIKQPGDWDILALAVNDTNSPWFPPERTLFLGATTFHVNPEPVSTILFLTGGLAMAGVTRKRFTASKK
jgi:hypothetical protein